MSISREQVEYVAHLARLELSASETEKITSQLDQILGYVEKLNELDTQSIEPTSHVIPVNTRLRQDVVGEGLPSGSVLVNAPDHDGDFFRVPKIIE